MSVSEVCRRASIGLCVRPNDCGNCRLARIALVGVGARSLEEFWIVLKDAELSEPEFWFVGTCCAV